MWKLFLDFTKYTAGLFDWTQEGDKGYAPIPQYIL